MREFSFLAVALGVVIGALLAAANAFVGLRVGMTISASIPAAVMAILVLKTLLKRGTILEGNMVQTVGSAGESLAGGMIFTVPALFIMGSDPTYWEMVVWGAIGGLLGVCFMVPLRQVLIVREHATLPFPEGIACAEVLRSGEKGGASARPVILGAIVGAAYFLLTELRFWKDTGSLSLKRFHTEAQINSSTALLGVGYILGVRVSAYMLSGAILAWFLIIPAIGFFGATAQAPISPATDGIIANMSPNDIWTNYVRYIGAGAVAIAGLISLFKSLPTIGSSFWHVLTGVLRRGGGKRDRTDRDVPFIILPLVIGGLGYLMWRYQAIGIDHIGVIVILIAAFFFVTVSSRLVGIIGVSSNPISGMTIATLLGAALIYKLFVLDRAGSDNGVTVENLKIICISVGAIVAMAIAVAADTSQDLKTGYLVKATPYKQQLGKTIGVLTSVIAVAGVVLLLNHVYGFGPKTAEKPFPMLAPQANIMKILVESVLGGNMPWTLILIGASAAVVIELLGLPSLPVAVGLYLPMGVSTPLIFGGVVRWLVDRHRKETSEHDPGVLTASGMVAGEGLMGVAIAGTTALIAAGLPGRTFANSLASPPGTLEPINPRHFVPWLWSRIDLFPTKWGLTDAWWNALPLLPFLLVTLWLWWSARRQPPIMLPTGGPAPEPTPSPEPPGAPALPPTTFGGPPLQPMPPMSSGAGTATTPSTSETPTDVPATPKPPAPRYRAASTRMIAPAPQTPTAPEPPTAHAGEDAATGSPPAGYPPAASPNYDAVDNVLARLQAEREAWAETPEAADAAPSPAEPGPPTKTGRLDGDEPATAAPDEPTAEGTSTRGARDAVDAPTESSLDADEPDETDQQR